MSQSDLFDDFNNEQGEQNNTSDTYTTESRADIYNTPDVSGSVSGDVPAEDASAADVVVESVPVEDGSVADVVVESAPAEEVVETEAVVPYSNPYNNSNNPYGNSPYNNSNNQYGNNPYNHNPYGYNPYGGQTPPNGEQGNNPYNNNPYNNNQYNNNQYSNNQYNNNQYGNNQYNNANNPYGYNPYGGQTSPNGSQGNNAYGNDPYGNNAYNNNAYGNDPYNNNPYGNGSSGNPPYNNNQYGPYDVPSQKKSTGLIIGIIVAVAVLFLIAFCALIYRAVSLQSKGDSRVRESRDDYRFDDDDDDWGVNRYQRDRDRDRDEDDYDPDDDYDDYDYDYDYDDWYDDWDDDYYYDDSEYYDFHDDVKYNLSYSIDFDYYNYETDNDNVYIYVDYPVIEGDDVPNLDKLNDAIWAEVQYFTDYYEDEYEDYMTDEDDYFFAYAEGYVTYMDEEKLSVVFQEEIASSYYDYAYVYCINIDMEHGVILDNENMLSIDDDFSADFRARSEVQNPNSKTYLSYMTDKEMTRYFNSSDIIVFYTPMGMEIGFNYDTDYSHGWVTVTYKEYEQYLKVF